MASGIFEIYSQALPSLDGIMFEKVKDFFKTPENNSILGALSGYSYSEKAHIVDMYNCYGIDAVIKYLN